MPLNLDKHGKTVALQRRPELLNHAVDRAADGMMFPIRNFWNEHPWQRSSTVKMFCSFAPLVDCCLRALCMRLFCLHDTRSSGLEKW